MYHVLINRHADSAVVSDRDLFDVVASLLVAIKDRFGVKEKDITLEVKTRSPADILPTVLCVTIVILKLGDYDRDYAHNCVLTLATGLGRTLPERLVGKDLIDLRVWVINADSYLL